MPDVLYEDSEELKESESLNSSSDTSQAPSQSQVSTSNIVKGSGLGFEPGKSIGKNEITLKSEEIAATKEPVGRN